MRKYYLALLSLLFLGFSTQAQAIKFKIKNFGLTVDGSFNEPKGEINFNPQNPGDANFSVTIDASSINTGIDLRDKHIRKEEYLDTEIYPLIKFASSKINTTSKSNQWNVKGKLTIKNVTKEISFPFSIVQKDGKDFLSGEFKINRRDFGVGGRSISMADEVLINLTIKN